MSQLLCITPVMPAGWPDLVAELDRWQEGEQLATLWWRDDDAVAPSANLDRLVVVAGEVPIALAVIPAEARPELAAWQREYAPSLAVLQHGWRHSNHTTSLRKSEFPGDRSCRDVKSDIVAGRSLLTQLFGSLALPVLVPPWNRFDDLFLPLLGVCGIWAISRVKPRRAASPAAGLTEVNVHVDLVAWKDGRHFIGAGAALGHLVGHLRARRLGEACADEPTGILTHHLVMDEATNVFLRQLVAVTCAHPAARWLEAAEIFGQRTLVPS